MKSSRRLFWTVLVSAVALLLPFSPAAFAIHSAASQTSFSQTASTTTSQTWTVRVGEESADHALQGMTYLPADVYIHPGDTVRWIANSYEPHTVTFLADQLQAKPPEFNPNDPNMLLKVGGSTYTPGTYFNSGLLDKVKPGSFPGSTHYSLTFPTTGTFTYFCLLHGAGMKGEVHVLPATVPSPFTQKDYDNQAHVKTAAILRDGIELWRETYHAVNHHRVVAMGNDDGTAMVMRFIKPTIVVHVGQSVTFTNIGMAAPHTVTFGKEPANFFVPSGNPKDFRGGNLNSGIVGPGGKFTVTFKKAGTFHYICALHDFMGMAGKVIVKR